MRPPGDVLGRDLGDAPQLGGAEIGELAGAAAREDDVHAVLDHPVDVRLERTFVDRLASLHERCADRHAHAFERASSLCPPLVRELR